MTTSSALQSTAATPRLYAPLTNMQLGLQTLLDCVQADYGCPRLGVFYGASGYGKTSAAAFAASKTRGVYVEANELWTRRDLLLTIAAELGITHVARTANAVFQQIVDQLNLDPRPLIVDEFDHIVKKGAVEIIRAIHDKTGIAVLMIGEEALPAKLKAWERFDNRLLVVTPAQPASYDDALKLRDHYRGRVAIADDLVERMGRDCNWIVRRIQINLVDVARQAIADGRAHADLAWWADRRFRTGAIPTRRAA